jgi:hypothetical protein
MQRRAAVKVPAAGLLPALFLGGLLVAAPFAGTTTGAIANSQPAVAQSGGGAVRGSAAVVVGSTVTRAAAGRPAAAAKPAAGKAAAKPAAAKPAAAKPGAAKPAARPAKPTLGTADLTLHIDTVAAGLLARFYLAIAALAVAVMLFALIWLRGGQRREDRREAKASVTWTDALTLPTARTGRSPARAARASLRRPSPAASAQRG